MLLGVRLEPGQACRRRLVHGGNCRLNSGAVPRPCTGMGLDLGLVKVQLQALVDFDHRAGKS